MCGPLVMTTRGGARLSDALRLPPRPLAALHAARACGCVQTTRLFACAFTLAVLVLVACYWYWLWLAHARGCIRGVCAGRKKPPQNKTSYFWRSFGHGGDSFPFPNLRGLREEPWRRARMKVRFVWRWGESTSMYVFVTPVKLTR